MRGRSNTNPSGGQWFQVVYELCLLLAAVIAILAPIHEFAQIHAPITQVIDRNHIVAFCPGARPAPGGAFPVYRFSAAWPSPIGQAQVEQVDGDRITLSYDPGSFAWPMGRSGLVTGVNDGAVKINLGANVGLVPGDHLNLFEGDRPVGRLRLSTIGKNWSIGGVEVGEVAVVPGLSVSEYEVQTQILFSKTPLITVFEALAFAAAVGLYFLGWVKFRRSPFVSLGESLRTKLKLLGSPAGLLSINLVVAIPFVWFSVRFLAAMIEYLADVILPMIDRGLADSLPALTASLESSVPV